MNKYTNILLGMALLTVIVTVSWYSLQDYFNFVENHKQLAKRSALSVGREIELFIHERKRLVHLFADNEQPLLASLADSPNDASAHDQLENRINSYFPSRFAFTIANDNGQPLFIRGKDLIGSTCRNDIQSFARGEKHPHVYVHESWKMQKQHFDIMAYISGTSNPQSVFFVSFFLDDIFRLLDHGKTAGHHLFLVKHGKQRIIEAATPDAIEEYTASGYQFARVPSSIPGEYRMLWPKNLDGDLMSSFPIPDTQWELIDVSKFSLLEKYKLRLVSQAAAIMVLFSLFTAIGFWLTRKIGSLSFDTQTVLASVEMERQRMAMDLHDQVLSDISHIRRDCQNFCSADKTQKYIEIQTNQIQNKLEQVTNTIRDIIDNLQPQSIHLLGLAETIRSYCNKLSQQSTDITFNLDITNWNEHRLSKTEQLNLFRIFQEVMQNTIKHAQASQCDISLKMTPDRLYFSVKDDGTGITKGNKRKNNGRGMSNITARARMIHARIMWQKQKTTTGTHFSLSMPLSNTS